MKTSYQPLDNLKISGNLPSMPQVLVQLIDACHAKNPDLQKIAELVEKDATVSAKVLQLVNSAYIGSRKNFTDTKQATVFLGTGAIKNLAITVSIQQVFRRVETNGLLSLDRFWYHSFQHAVLSEKLAEKISHPTPGDAYLAGLLHDIGKLLLWMAFPGKYAPLLLKGIRCHDARLTFLEQEKLDINHCQAGAWLCTQWGLPTLLADAIKYHHHPVDELELALPLVQITAAADIICHGSPNDETVKQTADKLLNLKPDAIAAIVEETEEIVTEVADDLGIRIPQDNTSSIKKEEESEEIHKETSLGLINRVRDITQLTGTLESLLRCETQEQILSATEKNLKILFNETKSLFLIYNDDSKRLQAETSSENTLGPELDTFYFSPREDGKSLIEQALATKKYTHSFLAKKDTAAALSILDNQLLDLLATEGFAAFPICHKHHTLGLLVMGFSPSGFSSLQTHATPLQLLLQHTAIALYLEKQQQVHAKQLLDEAIHSASLVARKVAHEINNPVAILQNYIHILELKTKKNEKINAELSIIEEELRRISTLTDQLKDLASENQITDMRAVNVNRTIQRVLDLYEHSREKDSPEIKYIFAQDEDIPTVNADENSLRQVLLNLINNAGEAMEHSGSVTIKTSTTEGMVTITISDDGPGIDPARLETVFNPGFTTKGQGHSGLGLAITRKIVNDLKGTITCESDFNGTTFSVMLPANTT